MWGEKIKGLSAPETVCSSTEGEHVGEEGFGSVTLFFFQFCIISLIHSKYYLIFVKGPYPGLGTWGVLKSLFKDI